MEVNSMKEFNELLEKLPHKLTGYLDGRQIEDYSTSLKQIDKTHPITFGTEVNTLIMTDRLIGCSLGLKEYLQNSTDITVDLVTNLEDARKIINEKPIDIFIFVGLLARLSSHQVFDEVREMNKYATVIKYSKLDEFVERDCIADNIEYKFERYVPLEIFFCYIQSCYQKQTFKLYSNFDESKTMAQLWQEEKEKHASIMQAREKTRSNWIERILSVIALVVLLVILVVVGLRNYLPMPFETDIQKEFKYTQDDKDNREVNITVSIKDEMVHILTEKNVILEDDNTRQLISGKKSLTLENALKYGVVYETVKYNSENNRPSFFLSHNISYKDAVRTYEINEKNLLIYCLFD